MNMSYHVGDHPNIVEENRKLFFSHIGISEREVAVPHQCHSNIAARVDQPGEYNSCDALITNTRNIALAVTIADCVPILLFDPKNMVIGVVHAGWRGTASTIVQNAVEMMNRIFHSTTRDILVFIGPSAGICCYEVGEEVAINFENKVVSYASNKYYVNLKEENKQQLLQYGVLESHIEVSVSCTICEDHSFHSYRRDGSQSGRMIAVICMR
jgi:polyphenol oxidase